MCRAVASAGGRASPRRAAPFPARREAASELAVRSTPAVFGTILTSLAGGLSACGYACVDTQTDATNCGQCSTYCYVPVGSGGTTAFCSAGVCSFNCTESFSLFAHTSSHPGPAGKTKCGNLCVDTTTDLAHCGGCNKPCATVTNGQPTCANSACDFSCTFFLWVPSRPGFPSQFPRLQWLHQMQWHVSEHQHLATKLRKLRERLPQPE